MCIHLCTIQSVHVHTCNTRKRIYVTHNTCRKDGTNLEFHSNRIALKFRIEYEISVASNSIRILSSVETSCRDAPSSRGQVHAGVIGIVAIRIDLFVYFWPSHVNNFLQQPNFSSHILCTYAHTRLQNKIIYIPVKNKIKKTNMLKTLHDLWHLP